MEEKKVTGEEKENEVKRGCDAAIQSCVVVGTSSHHRPCQCQQVTEIHKAPTRPGTDFYFNSLVQASERLLSLINHPIYDGERFREDVCHSRVRNSRANSHISKPVESVSTPSGAQAKVSGEKKPPENKTVTETSTKPGQTDSAPPFSLETLRWPDHTIE